ncbi:MAG: hypothetical protein WBG05_21575, partial [Thermoanaerobaculia bacterium]
GDDCQQVRLVEVLYGNTWRRFLTNELDPQQLPARYLVAVLATQSIRQCFRDSAHLYGRLQKAC